MSWDPVSYEQGRADERAGAEAATRRAENNAKAFKARAEELQITAAVLSSKVHARGVMVDALAAELLALAPNNSRVADLRDRLTSAPLPPGPAGQIGVNAGKVRYEALKSALAQSDDPTGLLMNTM